jgi:two-component system chemotaxis response regulator CheB
MPIKVLVVDDSRFYRNRLREIFAKEADFEVVATAENGREAVEKALELKPDVVTMDIEMPVMDGIAAVREIMARRPVPVMMFSSLTTDGAQATLDALAAGAVDFIPKRLKEVTGGECDFGREVCGRLRALARRAVPPAKPFPARHPTSEGSASAAFSLADCRIIAIGASTGGPAAVQEIIGRLPKAFPVPVLIIQHMPAAFTRPFAKRLDDLSRIAVKEAEDGDPLRAGQVYVAPGGRQMLVAEHGGRKVLRIQDGTPDQSYKPSVDLCFRSVAETFGRHSLAIVLTGMGADGRDGAAQLKRCGATVWAQDETSCVVYGMPQAVVEAGLADRILPIGGLARLLTPGA